MPSELTLPQGPWKIVRDEDYSRFNGVIQILAGDGREIVAVNSEGGIDAEDGVIDAIKALPELVEASRRILRVWHKGLLPEVADFVALSEVLSRIDRECEVLPRIDLEE